ncbi:DUF4347 domain-containing protein [Pseudoroseomonas ludipueritiae]|uniref:DUF4347 domain-containing protein n=1 Tax=Pseudoroseomonas ludipueritiae TaxID=198093 RepID=A0ABR7R3J9_9PROT|nr:DUF4347 domain-containing protein [Pseudoroseomonas ludipueritiae]MBC9176222.1 DUF4347 domain-containing protein [Pseudoroseomonas ludipueritiae]MCG7361199.1 DUF4347 domain-containing protein [Roseomonas sp. ACRSG]
MSQNTQLLVLDPRLEGWANLLTATEPGVAVLVLDPKRDGLTQLAEVAEELGPLQAIHIADHGAPGRLRLGSLMLDAEALATRGEDLARLRGGMAPGGALLLWGCEIGAGALGARFVAALSRALGRDVAASDDRTGPHRLGGDWELEVVSGLVQTSPAQAVARTALEAHPVLLTPPVARVLPFSMAARP